MTAYIVDTECTSLDEPEVIEFAWFKPASVGDLAGTSDMIPWPLFDSLERFEQRYRPETPTTFGALAVHNILPEELEGCPPSAEAKLPEDCEYIVAHNADHDWKCLGAPAGIKRICTDAIARWVWQDADSYSQSALIYMLLGPTPDTRSLLRGAHNALTDALNNLRLLEKILDARPEITTWSALYEYSEACRIPRVMPLGEKQGVKGLTLDEAVEYDFGFVQWCLRQDWIDDYLHRGLNEAVARYDERLNTPAPPDDRPLCQRTDGCVMVAGHDGRCDTIPF